MTLSVDLFFSFRSPYSYLATPRIVQIAADFDVDISVRPVFPIAIRSPEFFRDVNPLWVPYVLNDVVRVAEMNAIPFRWPQPDPVVMNMETRTIAEKQPYIHRLTYLGVAAAMRDRGVDFIDHVSRLIWDGGTDDWHLGDKLANAVAHAGLTLAELDQATEASPRTYAMAVETNHAALEKAGHWGVPTLVFKGEPFFGQDRIEHCLWRMRQHGLQKRA